MSTPLSQGLFGLVVLSLLPFVLLCTVVLLVLRARGEHPGSPRATALTALAGGVVIGGLFALPVDLPNPPDPVGEVLAVVSVLVPGLLAAALVWRSRNPWSSALLAAAGVTAGILAASSVVVMFTPLDGQTGLIWFFGWALMFPVALVLGLLSTAARGAYRRRAR